MGRTIQIFFNEPVIEADFARLVLDMNGYLADDNRVVGFSQGGGNVWIYGARSSLAGNFERLEVDELARLGDTPCAGLVLALSHDRDSGPLALRISHALLQRWRGRALLAIGTVVSQQDLELIATAEVIGGCFCVLLEREPNLDMLLSSFDALVVDDALAPSAAASLGQRDRSEFDPAHDAVVAMIAADKDEVWVVRSRPSEMPAESPFAGYVRQRIETDLPQPGYALHILLRRTEFSTAADRVSIQFATALLRQQQGLVAGTFDRVVDAGDLQKLLDLGHGLFVS